MRRAGWLLVAGAGLGAVAIAAAAHQARENAQGGARGGRGAPYPPSRGPTPPGGSPALPSSRRPRTEDLDEIEALARVITSEADGHTLAERAAVGWAVRNRARRRRTTIAKMVCTPECGPCCDGRPFSSARPAKDRDRELAAYILAAPQEMDPTGGASAILEPDELDRLAAAGVPKHRPSRIVRQEWAARGQKHIGTVGRWELWTT
jgi:hypothetical protein